MDTFVPKNPFTISMDSAFYGEEESNSRLNSAVWEVKKEIVIVKDALNGSQGFKVGNLMGIPTKGFISTQDLQQIIIPQILELDNCKAKLFALRYYPVKTGPNSNTIPAFSIVTDDRSAEEYLNSLTQENSPLTFRGRAVWFGTNSEFLAQPDSVTQE